jgi:hypothetical protein
MAVLTSNQVVKVWADGPSDRVVLYALRNVTTGDTAELANEFTLLKRAVLLGTTVSGAASAVVSGTVATMPSGLAGDAAYLLAWGCAGGS